MLLANALVCDENFRMIDSALRIEKDRIAGLVSEDIPAADDRINLNGCMILPGFIDIHIHGAAGADICDGTPEAIRTVSHFLSTRGVTRFCPTTMTTSALDLEHILSNIASCMNKEINGAMIQGIHLEGPFLSAEKCGIQNEKFIKNPDISYFKRLNDTFPGAIRIVDVAPEKEGAMEFVEEASKICSVSMSHIFPLLLSL